MYCTYDDNQFKHGAYWKAPMLLSNSMTHVPHGIRTNQILCSLDTYIRKIIKGLDSPSWQWPFTLSSTVHIPSSFNTPESPDCHSYEHLE